MSWTGKIARNKDGREGRIAEYVGFLHIALSIRCKEGGNGHVQLNSNGPDTGDTGWQWYCENFLDGPAWLPLGDHSGCEVEYIDPNNDRRRDRGT
jgi:hypothetical protein